MAQAMLYPEPEDRLEIVKKGGIAKAKKAAGSVSEPAEQKPSKARISIARTVLRQNLTLAQRRLQLVPKRNKLNSQSQRRLV
jgi:hypothetical protein